MNAENNKLATQSDRISTVRGLLEKMKGQIGMALPKHMSADRMLRVVMTSIQQNPNLLECTTQSLLGAIITASQLGLEPDGVLGQAYLVPFRNNKKGGVKECQLIPGYRGLIKLIRNSGELENIWAYAVYEGDHFKVKLGSEPMIEHEPNWEKREFEKEDDRRKAIKFVYCVAKLKATTEPQFDVMDKTAIERIRKRSKSGDEGPWITDYEPMALKTVIKRLCKVLPASVELQQALDLDNKGELGEPQELGIDILPGQPAVSLPAATPTSIGEIVEKEKAAKELEKAQRESEAAFREVERREKEAAEAREKLAKDLQAKAAASTAKQDAKKKNGKAKPPEPQPEPEPEVEVPDFGPEPEPEPESQDVQTQEPAEPEQRTEPEKTSPRAAAAHAHALTKAYSALVKTRLPESKHAAFLAKALASLPGELSGVDSYTKFNPLSVAELESVADAIESYLDAQKF